MLVSCVRAPTDSSGGDGGRSGGDGDGSSGGGSDGGDGGSGGSGSGSGLGVVADVRRLCAAVARARTLLYIVGHTTLRNSGVPAWSQLIDHAQKHNQLL
jgi:superfamily I DNA and/or RNA helicase